MNLDVHLVFPGNCEEAFSHYQQVLGGEISFILRKGDDKNLQIKEEEKLKISYMSLVSNNVMLAGEDAEAGTEVSEGNNTKLVLGFAELDDVKKTFEGLSQGAKITMPLQKVHFSGLFGELVDRFGISWIIMQAESKKHS